MKLAYLILAFKQPLQIARMVDRLNQPHVHFYIHYDKRSGDIGELKAYLSKYENVTIISKVKVNWGGYSQIQAELELVQEAFYSGINYKYYLLLSGQDYPIKDNNYINKFFKENNTDFISFYDVQHMGREFIDKFHYFHFYDIPCINPKSAQKILFLSYLYHGSHKHLKKVMPLRSIYKNMKPYFGSTKTALTHDTVEYVVDFLKKNKGFINFMKFTETPDETFFQTILLNSERKTNIYRYEEYTEWVKTRKDGTLFPGAELASLRYKDWSETAKVKPAVLDMHYYQILKESEFLFARKLDQFQSAVLLNEIDKNILGKNMWHPVPFTKTEKGKP
jgi:hypothetical protein